LSRKRVSLHILFTKDKISSLDTIQRLNSLGHHLYIHPILEFSKVLTSKVNLKDYDNIIFTSSNAVLALDNQNNLDHLKCFCVGSSTAQVAKNKGFQNIVVAGGNYQSLKNIYLNSEISKTSKNIYVRGEFISNDLKGEFKKEGYRVDELINYVSAPNTNFQKDTLNLFLKDTLDIVFIYSKRSADAFLKAILNNKVQSHCTKIKLRTVSENVFLPLKKIQWKNIKIFNPGQEEFCLD
jgi:uroporphyrinogen-III synthase